MCSEYSTDLIPENVDIDPHDVNPQTINLNENRPDIKTTTEEPIEPQDENSLTKLGADVTDENSDPNQMTINLGGNPDESHGDFVETMNAKDNFSSLIKTNEDGSALKEKNVILLETVQVEDEVCKLNDMDSSNQNDNPISANHKDSEVLESTGNCGGGDSPTNIVKSRSQSLIPTHVNLEQQEFTPEDSTRDFESLNKIHDRKTDVNSKEGNVFEQGSSQILSSDKNESLEPPLVSHTNDFNSKNELYIENGKRLKDSLEVQSSGANETLESNQVKDESSTENGIVNSNEECDLVQEKQSFILHDKETVNEESCKVIEQGDKFEQNSSKVLLQEPTIESNEILCSLEQSSSNKDISPSLRLQTDTENEGDKSLNRHDSGHKQEENIVCTKQREVDQCVIPSCEITENILDENPLTLKWNNEAPNELTAMKDTTPEVLTTTVNVLSAANDKENALEVQIVSDCRLGDAKSNDNPIKTCEFHHKVIEHSLLEQNTEEYVLDSTELQFSEGIFSHTNRNTEVGVDNSNNITNCQNDFHNTSYCFAHEDKIDFSVMEDRPSEGVENSYYHELNSQVTKTDHETNPQLNRYKKHVNVTEDDDAQIGEGTHSESLENINKPINSDAFSIRDNNGLVQSTFKENNNGTEDDHLMDDQQSNESDDDRSPTISEIDRDMEDNVSTQDAVKERNSYVQHWISSNMEKHVTQHAVLEPISELSTHQESNVRTLTSNINIGSNNVESSTFKEKSAPGANNDTINQNDNEYLCVDTADNQVANTISLLEQNQEKFQTNNDLEPFIIDEDVLNNCGISKNVIQTSGEPHNLQETTVNELNQFSPQNEGNSFINVDKFFESSHDGSVHSIVVSDKSCSVLASESDSDILGKVNVDTSDRFTLHSDEESQISGSLNSKSLSQIELNCTTDGEDKTDLEDEVSRVPDSLNKMSQSKENSSTALDKSDQNTLNQDLISLDKYSENYRNQITSNNNVHNPNASEEESSDDISMNTIIEESTVSSEDHAKNADDVPSSKISEDEEKLKEVNLNDELELTDNQVHSLTNTSSCFSENKQISIPDESEAININEGVIVEDTPENLRESVEPSKIVDYSQKETTDQEIPDTHCDQYQALAFADEQIIESNKEELERKENCILDSPQPRRDEDELDSGDQSNVLIECDTAVKKTPAPNDTDSWGLNGKKIEIKDEQQMTNNTINKKKENTPDNKRIKPKTNPNLINGATQTDELALVFQQIRARRSQPPIIIVHLEDAKSIDSRLETAEEKELNSLEYFPERRASLECKESVAKDAGLNNRSPIQRNKPLSFQGRERISTIQEVPGLKTNLPLKPVKLVGNFRTPNGMQNRSGQLLRQRTQTPSPRENPSVIPTIISPVSIIRRHFKGNTVSPRVTPRGDQSTRGTVVRHATSPTPANEDIPTISCPMSIASPSTVKTHATTPAHAHVHLDMARGGITRRRLQFGSQTESRNTSLCGLASSRSPLSSLQPSTEVSCRNQNKFPKDWYPGYRFYITKP